MATDPQDLPLSSIPDFIEERVIEILQEPEPARSEALQNLLDTYPDYAAKIRSWLGTALDPEREADRDLARTLGLFQTREPEPQRIGPYRILEPIGHGGMGSVYLAEQIELLRRRVALKLIKLGMDTQEVIARFEAERQALALMSHPNIARVYDAGVTEQGRPYFVMEYVPGVPITQYCDAHRLGINDRLDLLIQVSDAVHHAHQRGVVHRDLKPSNVLVMRLDGKPVPKIIDFGVAKATNQRLTEKTVFTQQGRIIGTPEYMSPEQAETSGLEVDGRTDVYSLGVLMYEILVGDLPFDKNAMRKAGLLEIHRIIREVEPPRPSMRLLSVGLAAERAAYQRRTTARVLSKELRGSLDWITMTAMEKDPARRYGSAEELSRDLVRYLNDERVRAGPPSSIYRLRTWVRRHRSGLLLAAVVVLALLSGGFLWWGKDSQLRDAESEVASLTTTLGERDSEVTSLQVERAKLREALQSARQALETAPRERTDAAVAEQMQSLTRAREQERLRAQRAETRLAERDEQLAQASKTVAEARAVEELLVQMQRLMRELGRLGRLLPADVEAMGSWLDRARDAAAFGKELRSGLSSSSDLVPRVGALVRALGEMGDDERGAIAQVEAWRSAAQGYLRASLENAAAEWTTVIAEVADLDRSPRYLGLRLVPLPGFVPLGPDPTSSLQEFAFLPSGEAPTRGDGGLLRLTEASAAVFVLIPNGELDMGGAEIRDWEAEATPAAGVIAHPLRRVLLSAFLVCKYELTQAQWLRLAGGSNPSTYAVQRTVMGKIITGLHPVESTSWQECVDALVPWSLDLPTEAQWEYGTRAGTYETWWTGNDPKSVRQVANLLDREAVQFGVNRGGGRAAESDGWAVHAPVGTFPANAFGLHDVAGNVAEWCRDWLVGYDLDVQPHDGLALAPRGRLRVHRGGSFATSAAVARSRYRSGDPPATRRADLGLRPVRQLRR